MSDAWEEMERAKEDAYFEKQNQSALNRLREQGPRVRLSPITGKPMVPENIHGVVVDRCVESGGMFLEKGELEAIVKNSQGEFGSSWVEKFIGSIFS